jgi:hypothetical protein
MDSTYALKISDGDLVLDPKGRIGTVVGESKLIQDIAIILKSAKGSYKFNSSFGTDLVGIVGAERNSSLITTRIRAALLSHPEINTVNSISLSFNEDRRLTAAITCTLVSGREIKTNGVIS